jgi:hypothetical protein
VAPPPKGTEWQTPLPSRTLKIARNADGMHETLIPDAPGGGTGFLRFVDSGGAALVPAERALYNTDRPSKDRFQWAHLLTSLNQANCETAGCFLLTKRWQWLKASAGFST